MGRYRTDLLLFSASVAFGLLMPLLIFGIDFYRASGAEVQLHDTYIVFPLYHIIIIFATLALFAVFLVRSVKQKFRNPVATILLILACALTLFILVVTAMTMESIGQSATDVRLGN